MKRLLCFLLCMLLLPAFCACEESTAAETMVVHFLDVGQGDAAIIQCGSQTLLIDGGDRDSIPVNSPLASLNALFFQ